MRGYGPSRVVCTCGDEFLAFADWSDHADAAENNLTLPGPGITVTRAARHIIDVLASGRALSAAEVDVLRAVAVSIDSIDASRPGLGRSTAPARHQSAPGGQP